MYLTQALSNVRKWEQVIWEKVIFFQDSADKSLIQIHEREQIYQRTNMTHL